MAAARHELILAELKTAKTIADSRHEAILRALDIDKWLESSKENRQPQPPNPRPACSVKEIKELDPLAPRPNLDFSKGMRGKYSNLLKQGTNLVIIAPDLLDYSPDSESVNEALRSLKKIAARSATPERHRKAASASR